jgi:hypothetical protein
VYPVEGFVRDEALQSLEPEGVLTQCQGLLTAEEAAAQPGEVARLKVFGAIDDVQVLRSAAGPWTCR